MPDSAKAGYSRDGFRGDVPGDDVQVEMPAHVIGHHRGEELWRGSYSLKVAGVFVDSRVHEHLGGRFVIVREAANPR